MTRNRQKVLSTRGFQVPPRRWVVERSLAWICHNRRMSKDYEKLCASGEHTSMVSEAPLL
jgi:transposase